jgi:hypothetical protein
VGLEFIATHFDHFLCRPPVLKTLLFSPLYEIVNHGSLRLESEDGLYGFISKGGEMNQGKFGFLQFVRLEYCSTDATKHLFDSLLKHFSEINASIWAGVRI